MKRLDDWTWVAGQIAPEEVASLAAQGVTMIVNNRPDGEEPDQPPGDEIEAAAQAAGLDYRHVPVGSSSLSADRVKAMAEALAAARGPALAFCRSGTRSTYLWALARAQAGDDPDQIVKKAAAAGYDLTPIMPHLQR